jgi:hypothetical protein
MARPAGRYSDPVAKARTSSTRIRLSERSTQLIAALKQYFADEFDDSLSDFRAEGLLQAKLADIDGEVYEEEAL